MVHQSSELSAFHSLVFVLMVMVRVLPFLSRPILFWDTSIKGLAAGMVSLSVVFFPCSVVSVTVPSIGLSDQLVSEVMTMPLVREERS